MKSNWYIAKVTCLFYKLWKSQQIEYKKRVRISTRTRAFKISTSLLSLYTRVSIQKIHSILWTLPGSVMISHPLLSNYRLLKTAISFCGFLLRDLPQKSYIIFSEIIFRHYLKFNTGSKLWCIMGWVFFYYIISQPSTLVFWQKDIAETRYIIFYFYTFM